MLNKSPRKKDEKAKKKKKNTGPPTQAEVDLDELRTAFGLIKGFPYSGEDAREKLAFNVQDNKDLKYAIDWLTEAQQAHVASQNMPVDAND